MLPFTPRTSFAIPNAIPKTYFLGHHAAGASKIKTVLSNISLVLECRDFRLPLSTHNPTLDRTVAGRQRIIVYTKSDLGTDSPGAKSVLRHLYGDDSVAFWDKNQPSTTSSLLRRLKDAARAHDSLTGLRVLVVGMPNVGKSTLLNALRNAGTPGRTTSKAAKTGDQAGVTRRIGTSVRIVPSSDSNSPSSTSTNGSGGVPGGVFVLDTPGIFQPYVDDGETMIKVALAHGVKKGLIADEILVDYLLYRMNQWDATLYERYCAPTNDVNELLSAVAMKDGKLKTGGVPNWQEAAARVLSQWREGKLGRYVLDNLSDAKLRHYQQNLEDPVLSMNQARKHAKELRKTARAGNDAY